MNLSTDGYVVHTTDKPLPLQAAAFISTRELACVIVVALAPLTHLAHGCNIGVFSHAIRKLQLHKKLALSGELFFGIHMGAHALMLTLEPDISYNGRKVYTLQDPAIISGFVMSGGYILASLTGGRWRNRFFKFHVILAIIATVAFFIHGSAQILGPPVGDQVMIGVFTGSAVLEISFLLCNPIQELHVVHSETHVYPPLPQQSPRRFLVLVLESTGIDNST